VIPPSWPYPPQTYETFAALRQAGFTAYCCGDRHAPHVLVVAYDWGNSYVDVVTMRGANRVTAARLPTSDGLDIFAPHQAVWHYGCTRIRCGGAATTTSPRPPGRTNDPLPSATDPVCLLARATTPDVMKERRPRPFRDDHQTRQAPVKTADHKEGRTRAHDCTRTVSRSAPVRVVPASPPTTRH
jgi:hypothetical protein